MAAEIRTVRRVRIGMVIGALVLIAYILYIARAAMFPFLLGGVLAYVISPLVERFASLQPWYARRPETARGVAILSIYGCVLAVVIIVSVFFVPAAIREVNELVDAVPELTDEAQGRVDSWVERYNRQVPENARERINKSLEDAGQTIVSLAETVLKRSLGIVFSTLAALLGYISVPFFVFYALKDRDRALGRFYALFPESLQPDVRESVRIANRVFGAYVRGQLILGLVIFTITLIGLDLMGVEFALALAVVAGITELIPIIGPLIGAVPAVIVVLATQPDHWWWVVLFYLGVQAAENYLLVPRIHAQTVSMHPALVLILISVGGALFGIWGVLMVVPVAAAGRDVFSYVYRRLSETERSAEPN